jgi:hypothetical protein
MTVSFLFIKPNSTESSNSHTLTFWQHDQNYNV